MKKIFTVIFFGNDSKFSALIAITIIALIGLGCFCNKEGFDFSNIGKENRTVNTNSVYTSNIDNTTPFSTPGKPTTKADASRGEIPSETELQEMAKTTLLDFNEAVQDENFGVFYGNISRLWQRQTTPEKLKDMFNIFIQKKIDIGNISSRQAQFSSNPRIDDSKGFKELVLDGKYSTSPLPTKFTLKYTPEGKEWKLTGIIVDTTP